MKIKVESEKIVKAVKKFDGIEIVLENPVDATEAISLILNKTDVLGKGRSETLEDVKVTAFQQYETSAVEYKMIFLIEFLFKDDVPLDDRAAVIKELQGFFEKI